MLTFVHPDILMTVHILFSHLKGVLLMDPQIYSISDAFIKRTKRTYLCMYFLVPIGILLTVAFLFFTGDNQANPSLLIGITVRIIVFVELELFIVSKIMLKKVKENTLTLGDDFLQRTSKKTESPLYFKDIQKLYIRKEVTGTVSYIDIRTSAQTVRLYGFENLDTIKEILLTSAPQATVKERQYKIDYNHPIAFIVIFVIALGGITLFEYTWSVSLNNLINLGLGVWILFFKPISKAQGQRFRILEIICGILIIGGICLKYLSAILG